MVFFDSSLCCYIIVKQCLALTIPEECLVSCQRCHLNMILTPNQWMVLVTNIAKSKILKQLKVAIHCEVLINIRNMS